MATRSISYLGEYLSNFLVSGRLLPRSHKVLASVQDIHVVKIPGYEERRGIPERECQTLIQAVQTALSGCNPSLEFIHRLGRFPHNMRQHA
ncbi:hypothetical protein ACFLV7_05535 [Chloroflexota bacterium]